jgi:hypothetical protein
MQVNRDLRNRRGAWATLAAAFAFLAASGCGQSGGSFNDTLADLHTKIAAAEKKMEDLIEFSLHRGEDQAKLKAGCEEFRTVVAEARTRFDGVTVPPGEGARKFHAAFADYLKVQEEAAPLYKQLVDPGRKLTKEEDDRVREGLRVMREKREPLARSLPSLQQAYAREAGLKLKK